MSTDITGSKYIVTGAATGIGWASAKHLHEQGASIVIWDRDGDSIKQHADDLNGQRDASCLALTVDVTSAAAVSEALTKSVEFLGGLNGAFNNAGVGAPTLPLADLDEADFDATLAVNLKGVFLCLKYQIAYLRDHGGGSIVNNSSVSGLVALAGQSAYTASKHGVVGLSKTAAVENAEHGIRVNAVCPGAVRTPIISHLEAAGINEEVLSSMSPQNRIADPEEIAAAVLWLLSPASSFVTGAAMPIDGGWSAR